MTTAGKAMSEHCTQRDLLRRVADRLVAEYAGLLPPGQVLATVFRANHSLGGNVGISGESRPSLCESFAREVLARRVRGGSRGSLAVSPWGRPRVLAS